MLTQIIQGAPSIEKSLITEKMYAGVNNKSYIKSIQHPYKGKIYYDIMDAIQLMETVMDNLNNLIDELRAELASIENPPFNKFDYQEEFKQQLEAQKKDQETDNLQDIFDHISNLIDSSDHIPVEPEETIVKPKPKATKTDNGIFGSNESNEWDVYGENVLISDLCKYLVSKNREAHEFNEDIPLVKLGDKKLREIMKEFGFISSKPIGNGRNRYIPSAHMLDKAYMIQQKYDIKVAGMDKKKVSYTLKITPAGVNYFVGYFNKHPDKFVD